LPSADREVESLMERQLLERLEHIRYAPGKIRRAQRPLKKDRLPPGESYTCRREQEAGSGELNFYEG